MSEEELRPQPGDEEAGLGSFFTALLPALRAFRYVHYRRLWAANLLSGIGNWMQSAAYGVLVYRLTRSAFWTAFIPSGQQLLMGPLGTFGGMLADRYNRRSILMVTQSGFALTTSVLAFLVITGRPSVTAFMAIALVNGVFMAANFPAYQALYPRLLPEEEISNAVALNSVNFNLARIVGPAVGAVLLQIWDAGAVFVANAATFAVFALALTRVPADAGRIHERSEIGLIGDGFRFARRNPTVGVLITGMGVISFFGLPVMWLTPLVAERVFGCPAANGYVLTAIGVGAVVGALLSGSARAERKPRIGIVSYFVFALSLGAFAWARHPVLSLVSAAIFGAAYMGAAVVINSLVQLATPDRLRGRVMSLYSIAWVGLLPLGALLAGAVAELAGAPVAMGVGACVCFLFAARLAVARDWVPRRFEEAPDAAPVDEREEDWMALQPGLKASVSDVVGDANTARALGSGDVDVYGTPAVVALVERAAVAALDGRLSDGTTSVGVRISLDHLAPTVRGRTVTAHASLESVDGRTLDFAVEASDDAGIVAKGLHTRVVVERDAFLASASQR